MPMVNPFIGSISITGFPWAPVDWTQCNGQQLQITQYASVYSLLGSRFGGNDRTYFNVPALRGRVPMGWGANPDPTYPTLDIGASGGFETITLTEYNLPAHSHDLYCTNAVGTAFNPSGRGFAESEAASIYTSNSTSMTAMSQLSLPTATGGTQSHTNVQPSLVLNFVLSLDGIYPPRN